MDVDGDECGRRGVLPVLFLARPPLVRSCRSACLNWSPAPGRGRRGRFGRFAAAGVRATCLRSHSLVPLSRSSLVRYRCRVRFPFDGPCDDPVFDRFRLSPTGVAWCVFSCVSFAVSRLERRVCRMRLITHFRHTLLPFLGQRSRLSCRLRSVLVAVGERYRSSRHRWYSPRPSYRWAGRSGGPSLFACYGRRCGVVGHPRSSCVGMWRVFLLRRRGSYCLPFRFSCRPAARFASLRHSPRPATRLAGEPVLRLSSSAGSSPVPLLAVRGAGRRVRMACYHHGSFSPWCVRACCVDYVAVAVARRSCGIFVL